MGSRRQSNVTHAIWIPLIWFMILSSRFFSQWLTLSAPRSLESPDAILEGSPIDRIFFLSFIIIGLFILSRRKINWSLIFKRNVWIFLFFYYCGISILWSDFPGVAFKRWIKEIGNLVMVLVILTESYPVEAIKTVIRRCAYVLIPLSILFYKYYPDLGRLYSPGGGQAYTGVTTSKNQLGALCFICGFFFFWNLLTIWRKKNKSVDKNEVLVHILFLIIIFWLLTRVNSATSYALLIIGFILLICLFMMKKKIKYLGIIIFHTVLIVFAIYESVDTIGIITDALGRDTTLTGRTDIWDEVLEVKINPIIGTGYDSFWLGERAEPFWDKYYWNPNQAHNGYLETYLNLGFIGLFCLIGVIIFAYKNISRELLFDFEFARFRMAFLVMVLFYNITEAAFEGLSLIWFMFLLVAIEVPRISNFQIHGTSLDNDFAVNDTKKI